MSISMNYWTNSKYKPILGVVAHFFDEKFEMKELYLHCTLAPHPHDKPNVKRQMLDVLKDYNIGFNQVSCITSDGAANLEFVTNLNINPDPTIVEPKFVHLRCVLHRLNLVIQDSCTLHNRTKSTIQNLKNLLNHFSNASKRREPLREACAIVNIESKEIIRAPDTRWNVFFNIAKRALYLKNA